MLVPLHLVSVTICLKDPASKGLPSASSVPDTPANTGGDIAGARTVRDPTGNCTNCHTLTTQLTGRRLAADAVGRQPFIANPGWGQTLVLQDEKKTLQRIDRHRTDWARRRGDGKIHPWMVPGDGNILSNTAPEIDGSDWKTLSTCLWGAGGAECGYRPLYTPCPPPETDGARVIDAGIEVLPAPIGEINANRALRVSWKYVNDYGGVPERDDVRFNVAMGRQAITASAGAPGAGYPTMEDARGAGYTPVRQGISVSPKARLIQNISYAGHARWTEPAPSRSPRLFELYLPAVCGQRYLVRVLPKRFCFDQSNIVYGSIDHLLYADVPCG